MNNPEWCHTAARVLQISEPEGLQEVLAFAGDDQERAMRFATTLSKIGLCPVGVARTVRHQLTTSTPHPGGQQA